MPAAIPSPRGTLRGLSVPARYASEFAPGLRPRGVHPALALTVWVMWPRAFLDDGGTPKCRLSRLNTGLSRSPVNASLAPSRPPTHDSGPGWIATPSPYRTLTSCISSVSRRTKEELKALDPNDKQALQELLTESEKAIERLKRKLPPATYPATRTYVLGLVDQGLSYLHHLLRGGEKIPLTTNRSENIMGQLALRLKKIGRRWSVAGGLNMIAAVLTSSLHPERYDKIERAARGEFHPSVSIIINDLAVSWAP